MITFIYKMHRFARTLSAFTVGLVYASAGPVNAQTTNIAIGSSAVQQSVNRLGMNLGQMLPYGSQQLYKNLFASNPGFSNTQYQSVIYCSNGTTSTQCVSGTYAYWPSGFWPTDGTVSIRVLTGSAAGCTTTLSSGTNLVYNFASPCNISAGDYITAKKIISPGTTGFSPTYGWTANGSGSAVFAASTDAPPASLGTTYTQSLQITTPAASDYAALSGTSDNAFIPWLGSTKSFINLNGAYTVSYWAKAVSGASPNVTVSLARGGTFYLQPTSDTISNGWIQYTHTFTASEVAALTEPLSLTLKVAGAESVLLAKVNVSEVSNGSNPTVFRDAVVATLQSLKPGVLRMSDQVGMTNTLNNMMVDQWARMPVNYSTVPINGAPGYYNPISYSIPEFLQLCQTVGADAWITLPVTFTTAEASELIDYLSAPSSPANGPVTAGAALRAAQGFSSPWTSVIKKIHLELGNEEWNGGTFEGASMEFNYPTYGAYAQTIFAAMKANPNYAKSSMSLALNAQFVNSYALQAVQNACNNNDEIDIAPYTANTLVDSSNVANIWQPGLAEPQIFWQTGTGSGPQMVCAEYISGVLCPSEGYFNKGGVGSLVYGGGMYLDALAEANSTNPVALSIYEENNSPRQGDFTQTELNSYASAWGAGLEQASQFLTNMQNGVLTQNLYELAGYYATPTPSPNSGGATYLYLWGSVVDMGGPTNLRRPQFLVEQLINSGITPGATMLATTQTGTPTFSVGNPSLYPASGSTVNTVAASSVNAIQSFAFKNGSGNYSLILLNLDVVNSHNITFGGANAPTGTVNLATLTSQNLGDNNESQALIAPSTSTLTNPTGMTLAPYAMYVLSWNATSQAAPAISNVSVTAVSANSATITWTTDQPSTSLVNYGTTSAYGSGSGLNANLVTAHSVTLTGLTPGTNYDFDVVSANAGNASTTSGNYLVGTLNVAVPPYVGYLAFWGITNSGVTVSWSTNVPATTQLSYGTTPSLGQVSQLQTALNANHGVVLTGLQSGTTYYFVAQSTGSNGATGNSALYSFTTGGLPPGQSPVISMVNGVSTSSTSATVTWTTDQPTTSLVNYGTTPGYGASSFNSTLATSHSVILNGLTAGTTYYFDVASANASNAATTSGNYTFTTQSAPPANAPEISYMVIWGITNAGATVTWSTNMPSTTQLAFGTTPDCNQLSPLQSQLAVSHGVVLSGLTSGTTYYYTAKSSANGVTGSSPVYSFTTY